MDGCPRVMTLRVQQQRLLRPMPRAPYACHLGRTAVLYMSMVLRIRPTATPSTSKGSPGSTTMVG